MKITDKLDMYLEGCPGDKKRSKGKGKGLGKGKGKGPIGKPVNELSGKGNFGFKGTDEIGKFWVVTKPTPDSTLGDFLFQSDVFDLALQLRGGLKGNEIVGIYKNDIKAHKVAGQEYRKVKGNSKSKSQHYVSDSKDDPLARAKYRATQFMEDPLYKAVLTAKNKKEMDKAVEIVKSIRGETAYNNFLRIIKK